jgi:hypothetical protein
MNRSKHTESTTSKPAEDASCNVATGCLAQPPGPSEERTDVATAALGTSYYVDPTATAASDVPSAGRTREFPWKTVNYAALQIAALPAAQQAGAVLNLQAGVLYPPSGFPSTLAGTAAQPIVVQPYGGTTVTFDAGLPALRQPNAAWEPVPASDGGVPGEWRTKASISTPAHARYAWGQLMASKFRLINYQELGDLRAQNESFAAVPLADPRPALGPLLADPTRKYPLVYLGPGVAFVFDDATETSGHIHVRLAPTHIGAPGITDYAGETNPNLVPMSIANAQSVALTVVSQHIVFKDVIVQNGGSATLEIGGRASDVTFDHCQVYGGRFGVRVGISDGGIHFRHCVFDGGLAPWTTRSDVKDEYNYIGPPGCPADEHGCFNSYGSKTHDILVIHNNSDSDYDHCTFRNAHDGIQVQGQRVEIAHSLFEDLNDESIQFAGPVVDVRIHENLVRGALNPLSFAVNPTGGPIYVYRNVIDQRVPTRGFRILPPDADVPWIWRYGADFKNGAMPELHVYQNTFVSSHPVDKGSWVTTLFANPATAPRSYLNNIHLVLNLDEALSNLPAAGSPASAAGNVWYRFHGTKAPLFYTSSVRYFDFPSLHADRPDWEVGSLYQDPHLANFTDEYFAYADGQPNTDYRPIANVGGRALPAGLPDVAAYAGTVHAGALPANAPPLSVGVDGATVLPASGVPIANAGNDQTITDVDGDGFATVAFNGSGSRDPEGGSLSFSWQIGGKVVSTAASPTLTLAEGEHLVRLIVTDPTGKQDSDAVVVHIIAPIAGDEHLANPGFESSDTSDWRLTAGATVTSAPLEVHSGVRALAVGQAAIDQVIKQRVAVTPGATYVASGWMRTTGLTPAWSTLTANVLDGAGNVLESREIQRLRGNSPYAYKEQVIAITAASAVAMELVAKVDGGTGTGKAFFDDLRVRDRNLASNGGFESRSPDGSDRRAPSWQFLRGGLVASSASVAHGGRRSLEFASSSATYQLVTQAVPHVPGRTYRLSVWVRTDGVTTLPTFVVQRVSTSGANLGALDVPLPLSEGHYTLVQRTLAGADLPATTGSLVLQMQFAQGAPGTARFDDVLLEPLP